MASVEEVAVAVRKFVIDNFLFGDTERVLADSDSLLEHEVVDSTGIMELVFYLEETYGIEVDDSELIPANLDSIGKVANFVHRKTESR